MLKNNYTESNMPQNYIFTIFLKKKKKKKKKKIRMSIKPLKTAAKIIFISSN